MELAKYGAGPLSVPMLKRSRASESCIFAGFHFSFVSKPQLTFDISLKGVMFSEVPGLVSELKRRLLTIIAAEAVEPARVWIDLSQVFFNLVTRKQAGKRGQLKVCSLAPCFNVSGSIKRCLGYPLLRFL
jgi:hypothetical protein